ncbi:MAG: phycobilisome protein [Leptolyngbyaceae bacterium]|nr:phycobilisome protein [Leptolyngbyaceae bacterium]
MLKAFQTLSLQAEGRYANDSELQFAVDYANSYKMRVSLYQKLQALEQEFIEDVHQQLMASDPTLFRAGQKDLIGKWKRDTMRVFKYSALALLLDDAEIHGERFLAWFQTIMRAFNAQRSCEATYTAMQKVAQEKLSQFEFALFSPILELNRVSLGSQP